MWAGRVFTFSGSKLAVIRIHAYSSADGPTRDGEPETRWVGGCGRGLVDGLIEGLIDGA
jgi:hypothetical protein